MFVTFLEFPRLSETYNRYDGYRHSYVLHKDNMFHLGRFPSMDKLKEFLDFAGLELGEVTEDRDTGLCGQYKSWNIDYDVMDVHFDDVKILPQGAKSFRGLSNGSLVTCYLYNDTENKILNIYRPNPNNKEIYDPMTTEEHIEFCRINGYV